MDNEQSERGMIKWELIRTDGGTQPREELDLDTIDTYAEDMLRGDEFPPLRVFYDGRHYWLSDGFHRLFAFKQNADGRPGPEIECDIFQGTKRDAILDSLGANARHGLPRSAEDKRSAVSKLLNDSEWSEWSDGVIAQKANVSQPFVSKLRRALPLLDPAPATQNVLSERPATWQETIDHQNETGHEDCEVTIEEEPAPKPPVVRRGADDRVINTEKIGRQRQLIVDAEKDIDVDQVAVRSPSGKPDIAPAWPETEIALHITIKAGKSFKRGVQMSGRAGGEGLPTFATGLTLADFDPLPGPIVDLVASLAKAAAKAANKPATNKPKPKKK